MRIRSTEVALLIAVFLDMVGFTMLIPDIQLRAESMLFGFAFKGPIIGSLLQSTFIVQLFASPRWGRLADSYGRKRVFVACQWISSIAMLMYGLAGSVGLLFVSRILAGFGGANVSVAQAMASVSAGEDRKRVLGWVSATLSAGMIFGPAVGGFAVEQFGHHIIGYVGAAISASGGLVVLFFVPNDKGTGEAHETTNPIFDFSIFRSYPSLLPFFWIAVTASFALATLEGTFGRLIHAMLGYGQKEFGIIFSYEAVLGIFVSVAALGWLSRRLCDTSLLRLGYVLQGVGLGLNPLAGALSHIASGMVWLFAASTLYAFGSGIVGPTLSTLASNTVPEHIQGELFGTMQSARTVGFIIGPILGGFLFDYWHALPYVFATLVCFVVAVALPAICACHAKPAEQK